MSYTVITIGREYGSGGRLIAQKLALRLSIAFYDREVIEMAADETGFSADFIRSAEERRASGFAYLFNMSGVNLPLHDQVFIAESEVIRRAAEQGPCVIVGRCADYVLRENPNCLRVFIHAPLDERIRRAREEYGIERDDLRSFVTRYDKARAAYYNYFATGKWGKCQSYDLSISSSLGIDAVVSTIAGLAGTGQATE